MLTGDGSEPNEIIQVNQNSADGTGYVLVADRELAAILGGHVDRDTVSSSARTYFINFLDLHSLPKTFLRRFIGSSQTSSSNGML